MLAPSGIVTVTVSVTSASLGSAPGAGAEITTAAGLPWAAVAAAPWPLCQITMPTTKKITSAINAMRKPRMKFCWPSSSLMGGVLRN